MNTWTKLIVIVVIGAIVGVLAALAGDMLGVHGALLGGVTGAIALTIWRSQPSA